MKRSICLFMLLVLCVIQFTVPVSYADGSAMTYDFLHDQGYARGDSVPDKQGSLPYTASWENVFNYTNTNKYFSGYGAIKVSLSATMNNSSRKGRFQVYFVDMTSGTSTLIIDSGDSRYSYSNTRYYFPDSSHSFYLKFKLIDRTGSSYGTMKISVP